jgi:dTDP-4-amino-4,6-dideoxygalactose transaminase
MFPNAERGYEAAVTVPFYPAMSDATAGRVLSSLRSALGV